jgi:hypothetical protein
MTCQPSLTRPCAQWEELVNHIYAGRRGDRGVTGADRRPAAPQARPVKYLHGTTTQYCLDAAVDKVTLGIAGPLDPDECQKIDVQRSGDAVTIDFACTMKGKPATALSSP